MHKKGWWFLYLNLYMTYALLENTDGSIFNNGIVFFLYCCSRESRHEQLEVSCDGVRPWGVLRMELWKSIRRQRPSELWRRRGCHHKLPSRNPR